MILDFFRLPCISGTMGRVHSSLQFLSCVLCQRTLPRPATVQPLWAKSLHCVWVSALYLDQFDCPQFPGNEKGAKLNDSTKQRMFTVRYWQSCNDVWWPSCPRLNPSHAGISRWSTAFIPHTVQPEKTEVFHLFCQINLRYQPIAKQHPFSLFPNSNQMFYSVFFYI